MGFNPRECNSCVIVAWKHFKAATPNIFTRTTDNINICDVTGEGQLSSSLQHFSIFSRAGFGLVVDNELETADLSRRPCSVNWHLTS